MLSTGIPELKCDDDIAYLRNAFALDKSEDEARKLFEELIEESLNTKATTVNFVIHNFAHANS
jgi:phosphatidylinositol-4,5-bisphosphate 3-kinase catalytic subunit alpha/beta/delta